MNFKACTIAIFFLFSNHICFGQFSEKYYPFSAKKYSKELSVYYAKAFLVEEVFDSSKSAVKFELTAIAAANSGELTTVFYKSEDQKKAGLLLGFYREAWSDGRLITTSYAFKNLPSEKATDLLNKLDSVSSLYGKYIDETYDVNNIYFQFEDIKVIIYNTVSNTVFRILWNNFDSEWVWTEVRETQKKFLRKLK